MIFSKDFSDPFHLESDDELKKLIRDVLEITGKNNMVDLFPVLQKFDPQGIKRHMTYLLGKCRIFFGGLIDERLEHRKNQPNIVFNDLLDSFLWSCDQEDAEEFDTDQIWHLCVELDMEEGSGLTLPRAHPLKVIPFPL
ncbi:hypothetical protein LIER_01202 [Lithospermum erythrorhizon]|uniref:Uncharacterized protein n=1 Tax=Lithospermum erythrorhizon TaxID=34254 RepID=A0AAV3NKL7_LITER